MRIFDARFGTGVLLLLCACNGAAEWDKRSHMTCWHGASTSPLDCHYRAVPLAQGRLVTVYHPEGGFRRFIVTRHGEIKPADGAEIASVVYDRDAELKVVVNQWRYLWPREIQARRP
jgi:hypothetical protein